MPRRTAAAPVKVKGFSDYFLTSRNVTTVLEEFGYSYHTEKIPLPRYAGDVPWADDLRDRIQRVIPNLDLESEIARREFLIAPILTEIVLNFGVRVNPEYAINVSDALRGTFDYLVQGEQNVIVIEAKLGDLIRGFKQLAAELVAFDQWTDSDAAHLYGAVTIGDAWRFARLDRAAKIVRQDIELFRVPADVEDITRVLVAILQGK